MVKEEMKMRSEYKRGVWSNPEKPKKAPSFESVVGVSDGKKAIIDSIVRPLQRPDLYQMGWNRCILLFGPPGTGKTLLASDAAQEIDAEFIEKDAAQINSKWVGESEQNVARLFNDARNKFLNLGSKRPIIIFIDEVDALFGEKKGGCDNGVEMRNQFLKELDSLGDKNCNLPLYVIASTNKPWNLDFAFVRRFQKRVYVEMPDETGREEMLKLHTSKLNVDSSIDFEHLSEICVGYSGSDLKNVCMDAYQSTIDRVFESDVKAELDPVSERDFANAIESRSPSVSNEVICQIEEWAKSNKAN
jgi:SpoVK/Ycf46/Vps4 family AAA+-type ATPase